VKITYRQRLQSITAGTMHGKQGVCLRMPAPRPGDSGKTDLFFGRYFNFACLGFRMLADWTVSTRIHHWRSQIIIVICGQLAYTGSASHGGRAFEWAIKKWSKQFLRLKKLVKSSKKI